MRHVESATPLSLDPDSTLPVSLTHPVTSTSSVDNTKSRGLQSNSVHGAIINARRVLHGKTIVGSVFGTFHLHASTETGGVYEFRVVLVVLPGRRVWNADDNGVSRWKNKIKAVDFADAYTSAETTRHSDRDNVIKRLIRTRTRMNCESVRERTVINLNR